MKKHARWLILCCTLAVGGLLALQFYWIRNYYAVNKAGFEKEVNLAFEDAIKKEFSLRCDTITQLIADRIMDTAEFEISSGLMKDGITYQHTISSSHNKKDKWSFSTYQLNVPVNNDPQLKKKVAVIFAETLRSHDFENHLIWYRIKNLNDFIDEKVKLYDFDTARLRPLLTRCLLERDITVPFQFYLKQNDSTMNRSRFPPALLEKFPVITKSFPTYKLVEDSHYVRALFSDPSAYIMSNMKFIFTSSILLILLVLGSMLLLFRMWFREKRLSAIKNDFISNITHEFKTPIATVSAAVEALSDFDVLENREQTARYLGHSKNELQRLSGLVDQLLHISVYENRQLKIKPGQVDVKEAVEAILQSCMLAFTKTIHFSFTNDTGIRFISADKEQFHHAVNNVVDNAVKYSGDPVTISINCSTRDNFLVLSFTDDGVGIAPKELPYVFDKFYRVKTANVSAVKGHGLGLNYVKHILDLHGGWCLLKSKPGQGSVISLAWPI